MATDDLSWPLMTTDDLSWPLMTTDAHDRQVLVRGASLRVAAASGRRYAQLDLGAPTTARSSLSAQRSAALNFEEDEEDDVAADERAVVGSYGHGHAHDDARAAEAPVTAPVGADAHADGYADAAVTTAAAAAGHRVRRAAGIAPSGSAVPSANLKSPASIRSPAGTLGTALGTALGTTLAHESPRLSQAAALNDVQPALLHDLICRGGPRGGGGGGGGGAGGAGGLLRFNLTVHSLRTLTLRVRCTACHEVRLMTSDDLCRPMMTCDVL